MHHVDVVLRPDGDRQIQQVPPGEAEAQRDDHRAQDEEHEPDQPGEDQDVEHAGPLLWQRDSWDW